MTARKAGSRYRSTIFHIAIEIFFATLPLLVLGLVWQVCPVPGQAHSPSIISSPEVSMTACVLYGLALVRLQIGSIIAGRFDGHERAVGMTMLSIIPLAGIILSVVFIATQPYGTDSTPLIVCEIANLIIAILVFFIVGGYGISRSSEVYREANES